MMKLSFTEEYIPKVEDVAPEKITSARERVVRHLSSSMPDVDMAPGTPTGDLVVSPLALLLASVEEANSRLMSDLDLANVADGVIYSCAFVGGYLGNFAAYDVENLRSSGVIRLVYSSPQAVELQRSARFKFNSDDVWRPATSGADASTISILAAGSSHPGTPDTYVLAQTSAVTWAVDIPVTSEMTSPVRRGERGTANIVPETLVGISAAVDFTAGVPAASLPELAKSARRVAHSLTAGSRASTAAAIYRHWPNARMVSPILPGDPEMLRTAPGSAVALMAPSADVYIRSSKDLQVESQVVLLDYVQPSAGGPRVFRGKLQSLHLPSKILSVSWAGPSTENLVDTYKVYSKSSRQDLMGCAHCGTRFEDIYLQITPKLDGSGTSRVPLLERTVDSQTRQYSSFVVTYITDPMLEIIASTMESDDHRPVGVDVLLKSGPLIDISNLTLRYVRREGTATTLGSARDKIVDYMAGAGYPDVFHQTALYDIMRYAGAASTLRIDCAASVSPSAASRLMRPSLSDPVGAGLLANWDASSNSINPTAITTVGGLLPSLINTGAMYSGGPPASWAATARTVRYYIKPEAVMFVESR
jgi:hypothetical protein